VRTVAYCSAVSHEGLLPAGIRITSASRNAGSAGQHGVVAPLGRPAVPPSGPAVRMGPLRWVRYALGGLLLGMIFSVAP
jgi:hypothetical protein